MPVVVHGHRELEPRSIVAEIGRIKLVERLHNLMRLELATSRVGLL